MLLRKKLTFFALVYVAIHFFDSSYRFPALSKLVDEGLQLVLASCIHAVTVSAPTPSEYRAAHRCIITR